MAPLKWRSLFVGEPHLCVLRVPPLAMGDDPG